MSKLTKAQIAYLRRLAIGPSYSTSTVGRNLVIKRLAARNEFGCLSITDAGRAALEQS